MSREDDDLIDVLVRLGLIVASVAVGRYVVRRAFGGFQRGRYIDRSDIESCEDEVREEVLPNEEPEEEETVWCDSCGRSIIRDNICECVSCGDKCCIRCINSNGLCGGCYNKVQCEKCGAWVKESERYSCERCGYPYCAKCVAKDQNPQPNQFCCLNCQSNDDDAYSSADDD